MNINKVIILSRLPSPSSQFFCVIYFTHLFLGLSKCILIPFFLCLPPSLPFFLHLFLPWLRVRYIHSILPHISSDFTSLSLSLSLSRSLHIILLIILPTRHHTYSPSKEHPNYYALFKVLIWRLCAICCGSRWWLPDLCQIALRRKWAFSYPIASPGKTKKNPKKKPNPEWVILIL